MTAAKPTIAILGGTGDLGGGLAVRWSRAGYKIIIGSRTLEKALEAAKPLGAVGMDNAAAARACDIAVLTVPFANQKATLEGVREALAGKILIDVTVPLVPPRVARVQMPPEGCAALAAQAVLGENVTVVSAFQNVGASHLRDDHPVDCDVLVCGDRLAAREQVIELVEAAGMKGWHAGPLANSVAAEALTSVLIGINKRYQIEGAGLRITGTPGNPSGKGD
ncbi:MAG: 8-hydroxy-5-deazaflavin:NADPH oxidoreductase [Alphaproteobacteria bacterium]|nr:8-hydroxy-5-deazaflavin:NADPH oxidoreductase [Alphaproteobacteria bacterium]